jgi:hypothetical protein
VTKSTNQLHYLIRVQIILKGGNKYMYAIPYGKPYLKQFFLKEYKQIRICNSRYYFRWLIFVVCWIITLNSSLVITCHRLFLSSMLYGFISALPSLFMRIYTQVIPQQYLRVWRPRMSYFCLGWWYCCCNARFLGFRV